MNALFYAPQMAGYGGMERHVCGLAAVFAARGHTVRFVTTSNSLGPGLRAELAHPLIAFAELPCARESAGVWRKSAWLLAEARRSRRRHWDVIYTNGQSALSLLPWLARRPGTRIVHHHHNAADAPEQATWSRAFRQVLARAPELIGCSEATCAALNAAVGRADARFLPYLAACPLSGDEIADRPVVGRPLRFGFCGRLIPEKGVSMVLDLADDASLGDIEWHIHGAGPAYPPERFRNRPRLFYHGAYRSAEAHARALLDLDALVLFSTHNEGMPLSLIEAMSAGLPWIATDRGGTRELAAGSLDSLLVPASATPAECRDGVRELARRIRSGETSRRAQRDAYDARFAPLRVAARWLDFFAA